MAFWVSSLTTQAKLTAGTNVTISSSPSGDAVISASGGGAAPVQAVNAGTGIAVSPTTGTPVISNTGVTSIIAGSNTTITSTGAAGTGAVTINAAAAPVQAINAGTGIAVSPTTGTPVISNTGVTSIIAGSNTTITSTGAAGTGAVTINAAAAPVQAVNAGTGISVSATTGTPIISNTGVTSIIAGTNITTSGSSGAVTINASSPAYRGSVVMAFNSVLEMWPSSEGLFNIFDYCSGNQRSAISGRGLTYDSGTWRPATTGTYRMDLTLGILCTNADPVSFEFASYFNATYNNSSGVFSRGSTAAGSVETFRMTLIVNATTTTGLMNIKMSRTPASTPLRLTYWRMEVTPLI